MRPIEVLALIGVLIVIFGPAACTIMMPHVH